MSTRLKAVAVILGVMVGLVLVLALVTRSQAQSVYFLPPEKRPALERSPQDFGMQSELVHAISEDGLTLYGWYIPGDNGAAVMVQHGSPGGRQDGLQEAAYLNRAGFSVLLGSFRAHDECDGLLISYGYHEQKDLTAWHEYLLSRDEVDPDRIGMFGESMGGGSAILYSAAHPDIQAVATASAFALTQETIEYFIQHELDPPRPLTPILAGFIRFWVEQGADFSTRDVDTEAVIAGISPRPVLIIHGQADNKIGPSNGQRLYQAAAEPKELWQVAEAGHVNFEQVQPEEYERRLVDFFSHHLLRD